jgi:flavin-dependent dehydrogenase
MAGFLSFGGGKDHMSARQPITIVGGGLAGLSLGIALRKAGVPTHIIEAGDDPRHRVCGEFITGLDHTTIEKLGIGPAFAGIGCHRSVTFFLRESAVSRQILPSPARAISRHALDARLAELFTAAGGRLSTGTRFTAPIVEPGWVQTNGRKRVEASPWMGLMLHARNLATSDELELHLGDNAYVGLSAVEDGWINVCGVFRRRPDLEFDRDNALPAYLRASGLSLLAERLASAEVRSGSRSAVVGFAFDRRVSGNEGVQLGDACAMIPPFTGNGMAMAFISSALGLGPLTAWSRGERSWTETVRGIRDSLSREFDLRLSSAAVLHPFLLNRIRQRCLGTVARAGLLPLRPMYQLLH